MSSLFQLTQPIYRFLVCFIKKHQNSTLSMKMKTVLDVSILILITEVSWKLLPKSTPIMQWLRFL